MSELLEHVFNHLKFSQFIKAIKIREDWEYIFNFCPQISKWQNIKGKSALSESKEIMLNNIASNMITALENDR